MFLLENQRLQEQLKDAQEKYDIASEDLENTSKQYENIKEEYEKIEGQITLLDETIEKNRSALTDTSMLRGKLEGEINVLKEQIHSARNNEEHLKQRREAVLNEIAAKNQDKEGILSDKGQIDEQVAEIEKKRDEAKAALTAVQSCIEELNNQIEGGKNAIIEALNARATIKSKLGRYDTMTEQVNIRKAELTSRILRMKSDEAQQEETLKALNDEFEKINEEIRTLNDAVESKEEKLTLLRETLADKDKKLRDTQVSYHQEKSRLEALSNLTERYEGYGGSVKKVMERKEQEKGIVGVVADIIKVDKKYETAIETALGGNIQNIVTDDEETAKRMIGYLKQTKAGRATFLPLTSITHPQEFKNPESLKEKGVLGMADELVHVDEKYRNVAKAMLGRIVVVDQVDNAVRIARKFDYGIRMVTLEGELLVPGGAISGGAFKNNSNLLGRRREMEEMEASVKKYLKEVDTLLQEIEDTKAERNKLRLSLEEDKASLQKKFIEQNTARLNVIKAKERKEEASESSLELKNEEREIESQIQEIRLSKEEISRELQDSETLEKQTEGKIKECQVLLDEKRSEESENLAGVNALEVEVEKMLQQQGFHQQNVDRINTELERSKSELSEIEEGLLGNTRDIEQKENNIRQIEETIQASHTSQNDTEKQLQEDITKKEELSAKQKNFFKDREALSEKMAGLDKEVYRLNAQREKLQDMTESQINYMWDEYEITLSDAAGMRNEELNDLPAMKRDISTLKDQIKKLGDVNVNAIEDYKNLMERYSFLKTQHDDLIEAEKTLEGIITELDTAMRKQFHEKFGEISREFDKVFKEMFGGGKGTLELMEDEDILEAGIRIIAQPPGKKLQNMMQLSGGEKALTAIALLFAIQNLKPSPFCLLDEIEAALDESNVSRFAKYLHKLTRHTQFIVITHRRGTMEQVDRLYGITMQEKGVSTLVSVNLIDKELDD